MRRMTDEQEGQALRVAFETILDVSAEPTFSSVADAAVAGGRRIRRRRMAISIAGVLAVAALTAAAITLPGSGPDHRPAPHQRHNPQPTPTSTSQSTEAPTPPTQMRGANRPNRPMLVPAQTLVRVSLSCMPCTAYGSGPRWKYAMSASSSTQAPSRWAVATQAPRFSAHTTTPSLCQTGVPGVANSPWPACKRPPHRAHHSPKSAGNPSPTRAEVAISSQVLPSPAANGSAYHRSAKPAGHGQRLAARKPRWDPRQSCTQAWPASLELGAHLRTISCSTTVRER